MKAADLSIMIPARNEMFLRRTVEDLLAAIECDTEILIGCDGNWPDPPIEDDPRVKMLHVTQSIGQRGITNQLARLSAARYLMKVDAHCAFDRGFDRKMIELMEPDITMAPIMRNLHAFNWKCEKGHTRYQSPSGPCTEGCSCPAGKHAAGAPNCTPCGLPTERDVVWIAKTNPASWAYCFDPTPHFQYDGPQRERVKGKGPLTETMSLQGSCFLLTRDKYWELEVCDERFGSWGSQGIEVAAKTWLSGGRVLVNHNTWYAHLFRTQGGDFSFPYEQSGRQVERAKKIAKEHFFEGGWDKAIHPLSWLVEKFWPLHCWTQQDLDALKSDGREPTKAVLYYSDNRLNMRMAKRVRDQIALGGLPVTSVTLKPTPWGRNLRYRGERGVATMFKQILHGLENMTEDIVYFAEHDVLYHPSHYQFTPTDPNVFYYAGNYWFVRCADGFAIHYNVSPLSGLVGFRTSLITHFRERVEMIERDGFSLQMGYEPMTHNRIKWEHQFGFEVFMSEGPNIDLAHEGNTSWKRWSQDKFRRKPAFWEEGTAADIPGWGDVRRFL